MNHDRENCTGLWWFEERTVVCMDCRARYPITDDTQREAIMSNYCGILGEFLQQEGRAPDGENET